MLKGLHTLRNGFSTSWPATAPRKYSLDNGDFELNMKILDFQIMAGVDPGQLDMGNARVLFVIATTAQGATPQAVVGSSLEEESYQFRFNDDSQIAWGSIEAGMGSQTILDPGHIIPGDLYVNAWTITTGGTPNPLLCPVSYLITMGQVKGSGAESLLYQVKLVSD